MQTQKRHDASTSGSGGVRGRVGRLVDWIIRLKIGFLPD